MKRVALDVLLPLLLPVALYLLVAWPLFRDPDAWVLSAMDPFPSDQSGQAWFHWWVHRASLTGADIAQPDVVCAPNGIHLDSSFSNTVDAWLAWPAYHFFPFPSNYNFAGAMVVVVTVWFGWLGFRAAGARPVVAIVAGLSVGFSNYVIREVELGHSANAFLGPAVLLIGAWAGMREGRLVWAPVAALAGTLAIRAYPPYSVAIAPVLAGIGLEAVLRGPRRLRALGGYVGAGAGLLLAAWWTAAEMAARNVGRAIIAPGPEAYAAYDHDALPWNWPLFPNTFFAAHNVWFSGLVAVAALGLALWRRVGWGYLLAAVWFWLTTLGVTLTQGDSVAHVEPVLWGQKHILLGAKEVLDAFPRLVAARPYRIAPFVLVALLFAVGRGAQSPRAQGLAVLALGVGLGMGISRGFLMPVRLPWAPSPALDWLHDAGEPGAVVEFPMGRGHATGWAQVIHGRPRSDGFRDVAPPALFAAQAPSTCYHTSLVRTLWGFERGASLPETLTTQREEARAAGFRYLVVFLGMPDTLRTSLKPVRDTLPILRAAFGPAVQEDRSVVIFAI